MPAESYTWSPLMFATDGVCAQGEAASSSSETSEGMIEP